MLEKLASSHDWSVALEQAGAKWNKMNADQQLLLLRGAMKLGLENNWLDGSLTACCRCNINYLWLND